MTVQEIRDLLHDALAALEVPSPMSLRAAERYTDDANAALRELTDPPDPYKDMALRPSLNFRTVGEAAAAGMIAPPPPKEASDA